MQEHTESDILHHYQKIAAITQRMRLHAQSDDWEQVLELAPHYHAAVECLQELGTLHSRDRTARQKILTAILDDDAYIRSRAAPQLERLGQLLGTMQRQRSLEKAYSLVAG